MTTDPIELTPIPVRLHPDDLAALLRGSGKIRKRRSLRTNTYTLTSALPTQPALPQANNRTDAWITSAVSAVAAVTTPSVPASTVAAQNLNNFPVTVVITGGTITAVIVNGVTVGTAAGTYVVPAFGAISITYSAAPTWAWSAAVSPAPVIYVASTQAGANAQAGGSTQVNGLDTTPFPVSTTDQVWISAAAGYPVAVSVLAIYEEDE